MREIQYCQAIKEALSEELARDEKVFLLGESIRGGNWPTTEGLVQVFGEDRVLDTPIAETALCGAGIGAAMNGYRPIVDLMFIDFMYVAADEILGKAALWHFMHGGTVSVPIVFMGAAGGGLNLGAEHSSIPLAIPLHRPGIKVVAPSNPYDAKGLLKAAIRDNNPVMYFWHKALMNMKGEVPDDEYIVELGKTAVKREGTDVTVVAISKMVNHALEVAEELEGEVSVEVIDPRTLEPLDLDPILKSVDKTSKVVIVDEDMERCGMGGELCALIQEKAFYSLDAPIKRVCAANYPIPGGSMEQYVLPQPAQIKAAIQQILN